MIQLAERLPELMAALQPRLGSIALRPLAAREGRAAGRVLIRARKGGRGPFRLLSPLILHAGAAHPGDRDHFTQDANAILRESAPLPWE